MLTLEPDPSVHAPHRQRLSGHSGPKKVSIKQNTTCTKAIFIIMNSLSVVGLSSCHGCNTDCGQKRRRLYGTMSQGRNTVIQIVNRYVIFLKRRIPQECILEPHQQYRKVQAFYILLTNSHSFPRYPLEGQLSFNKKMNIKQ